MVPWTKCNLCVTANIFFFLLIQLIFVASLQEPPTHVNEVQPQFIGPILNVTVAVGRDLQLPCTVSSLGSYKVAWLRVEDKGILTIHDHVITRNYRINLIHAEEKQFTLLIKNIQPSDAGGYMCQINTVPMKSQVGYVEVVVPPQILANESSSDVVATEGSNVTLECRASGHPPPVIQWKREDRKEIALLMPTGKKYMVVNTSGEELNIYRITRLHMGPYICLASNGILPSVSKRVLLKVQFPPSIWMPTSVLSVVPGKDATLSCHIEAFPSSVNYWLREATGKIIESNEKYSVEQETRDYKTHLTLTIRKLESADFGLYTCLAKNSLGAQEGSVKIHGIPGRARGASASSSSSRRPKKPASSASGNSQKDAGQFHAANGDLESGTEVEDDGSFPSKSHFLESESVYDSSDATSSSSFYQSSACPVLVAVTIIISSALIIPVFPLILLPVRAVFW